MRRKNPTLAVILILFFGPIGFLYLGWRYALLAFALLVFFVLALSVIGFPVPWWMKYFILPALAYKGYKGATFTNKMISEGDEDIRYLSTFPGAVVAMSDALVLIAVVYCLAIGIFTSFQMLLAGRIGSGLVFLFLATPILTAIAYFVFGFVSGSLTGMAEERLTHLIEKENEEPR